MLVHAARACSRGACPLSPRASDASQYGSTVSGPDMPASTSSRDGMTSPQSRPCLQSSPQPRALRGALYAHQYTTAHARAQTRVRRRERARAHAA
jgi:hypothetical protein